MQVDDALSVQLPVVFFGFIPASMPDEGALESFLAVVVDLGEVFNEEILFIEVVGYMMKLIRMQSSE